MVAVAKTRRRTLPAVGTVLEGTFKKKKCNAKIVKDKRSPDGRAIEFRGKLYQSMTAAAKAITKQSVNGWRFWRF